MNNSSDKVTFREVVMVSILGAALIFLPGFFLGTITSGLHLVDDHEILGYVYNYNNGMTLPELVSYSVRSDIVNRFRPLYMAVKALLIPMFGDNLIGYELLKAFESLVAFIFIYLNARNFRPYHLSKLGSFAFTITVFLGYQSSIWWKLGTHEIQGILLFSVGFFLLQKYIETAKKGYLVIAVILFEMMIFYKENLFLLIPFVGLYVFYIDLDNNELTLKGLWAAIKKRLLIYIVLLLLMAQTLYGCLFIINPNEYKGGTYNLKSDMFNAEAWGTSFHSDLKWLLRFGLLFTIILLSYFKKIKKYWKEFILGIIIILPQVLIYASIGMTERYIVPASVGFAYIFVYIPFATGILRKWRKKVYIVGLILLTLAHGRVMLREADYYRFRGNGVQTAADFIVDTSMSYPDVKILSTLEYFESNKTLELYSMIRDVDRIYFYHSYHDNMYDPYINRMYDGWNTLSGEDDFHSISQLNEFDVIIMYSDEDRHYTSKPQIDTSDFEAKRYGTLDVYVRNGSGINFPDSGIEPLKINF